MKGPVDGATVTVKNAATGAVLGTTTTSATGTYTLDVPFTGDVVVEVSGGNYLDEATSVSTALSTPMRVVLSANGGSVTGVVTPLTTLAYTYAFGTSGTPTSTAYNTVAANLATQLQMPGVNLATTVPVVTGTVNDYGRLLAGISTYLQLNNVSLQSLISTALDEAESAQFSVAFTTAYNTANPDRTLTFTFDGSTLNLNYCINGIAADSCNSGNASLSEALSNPQGGLAGAANLTYTYSATCVSNPDFTINLN